MDGGAALEGLAAPGVRPPDARGEIDRAGSAAGIFCGSDQIARGVADGLRDAGIRVPDEIAIVGFDNWDVMVEGARPPLTTIDPNLTWLGQLAASRLLAAIDGGELGSGLVLQSCDLVIRQSSVST
jgi:LacI family transcriptional regulator